ncbi:hypothetical protein M1N86_01900 [Dehalococcoidia bacterium]|nr:hypothetical protein [Dehalococcoidia bacterium]
MLVYVEEGLNSITTTSSVRGAAEFWMWMRRYSIPSERRSLVITGSSRI